MQMRMSCNKDLSGLCSVGEGFRVLKRPVAALKLSR